MSTSRLDSKENKFAVLARNFSTYPKTRTVSVTTRYISERGQYANLISSTP